MSSKTHYDSHLGPIYRWMAGDFEAGVRQARALFDRLELPVGAALDLGCGHGFQSRALVDLGYEVTAVDTCEALLADLKSHSPQVHAVLGDLSRFRGEGPYALVSCMGDTLPHLATAAAAHDVIGHWACKLAPGGCLAISLRDYRVALTGDSRFIPVRADAERSLTCFLEYTPDRVRVFDLLHTYGAEPSFTVSSYWKLRLNPDRLASLMTRAGLTLEVDETTRGMRTLVARRPR